MRPFFLAVPPVLFRPSSDLTGLSLVTAGLPAFPCQLVLLLRHPLQLVRAWPSCTGRCLQTASSHREIALLEVYAVAATAGANLVNSRPVLPANSNKL